MVPPSVLPICVTRMLSCRNLEFCGNILLVHVTGSHQFGQKGHMGTLNLQIGDVLFLTRSPKQRC